MFKFNKKTLKEYKIADYMINSSNSITIFNTRKDFVTCIKCNKYQPGYSSLRKDKEGYLVKIGTCLKCTIEGLKQSNSARAINEELFQATTCEMYPKPIE